MLPDVQDGILERRGGRAYLPEVQDLVLVAQRRQLRVRISGKGQHAPALRARQLAAAGAHDRFHGVVGASRARVSPKSSSRARGSQSFRNAWPAPSHHQMKSRRAERASQRILMRTKPTCHIS